jgi:hypothetical protein
MRRRFIARDLLIVVCAISGGIHAALAPEHFGEATGAGAGFVAAALLLAVLAVALTGRAENGAILGAAALTLTGLIVGYALAVSTGVPLLHPEVEPLETLALITKAVEATGLVAALWLLPRPTGVYLLDSPRLKGSPT